MSFYDVSNLPLVKEIINNLDVIKEEFNMMRESNLQGPKQQVPTYFQKNVYEGKINSYPLKLDKRILDPAERKDFEDTYLQKMERFKSRRNICKFSSSLIDKHPNILQYFFNEVYPKGTINKHYGVGGGTSKSIAIHFRIQITIEGGEDCYFFIEKNGVIGKVGYFDGSSFGFKDGMELHWFENNGDKIRTALIIDIDFDESIKDLPELKL